VKASYKRTAFCWSTAVIVTTTVFYLAKPLLSAEYRAGLAVGITTFWLRFVANKFADRLWPDFKKGWAE
jgi:hypothetical protein